jgi:hypothetical protein
MSLFVDCPKGEWRQVTEDPASADNNQLTLEFWVIQHLNRRVEGIHIKMDDRPCSGIPIHVPGL